MFVTNTNNCCKSVALAQFLAKELCFQFEYYIVCFPIASHKSNPSSVPQGIVDLYSTLPWVMWEAVTVVEGTPW